MFISQNVKRRAICPLCFSVAPLPKGAKHRSLSASKGAGPGNTPQLVLIARARHRRLFDRTLTRLQQPITALVAIQLRLQFFRKRQ
jgi:hypothetical protein